MHTSHQSQLLRYLGAGLSRSDAFGHAGVTRQEFYRELMASPAFRDAVRDAEAGSHQALRPIDAPRRPQTPSVQVGSHETIADQDAPTSSDVLGPISLPRSAWLIATFPILVAVVLMLFGVGSDAPVLHW